MLLTNCFLNSSLLVMNLRVRIVQLFSDILADVIGLLGTATSDTLSDLGKRKTLRRCTGVIPGRRFGCTMHLLQND